MKDWVSIYSSHKQQNAEIVKGILTHNDIYSVVLNKQDSFYKFGDYEVFVKREDVVKAKYILQNSSLP